MLLYYINVIIFENNISTNRHENIHQTKQDMMSNNLYIRTVILCSYYITVLF